MQAATPLLVFAHYFGGSARSWAPLLTELGDAGDSAAPDLAGFGGTGPPPLPSLDACADQIEAIAGDRPWVAVGHSFGGKIVLAAAARHPAKLKGLILIAPSPPTPEPMREADRRQTIEAFGDRRAARAHVETITDHNLPSPLFETCVEDALRVARSAWLWWLERGSREDISARTKHLDLPVLVLAGDQDKVLGLDTPFRVAAGLRKAEVRVIPGGGHFLPLEQPVAVAGFMRDFLGRLPSDQGRPEAKP